MVDTQTFSLQRVEGRKVCLMALENLLILIGEA